MGGVATAYDPSPDGDEPDRWRRAGHRIGPAGGVEWSPTDCTGNPGLCAACTTLRRPQAGATGLNANARRCTA